MVEMFRVEGQCVECKSIHNVCCIELYIVVVCNEVVPECIQKEWIGNFADQMTLVVYMHHLKVGVSN